MEVDFVISLTEIGEAINSLSQREPGETVPIPEDVKRESAIAERVIISIDTVSEIGEQTIFSCPDCGGGLWSVKTGNLQHYRCHIGHSYSETDLDLKQSETLESTLWVALRIMEERRKLLKNIEEKPQNKGFVRVAREHQVKRVELDSHIDNLKNLLFAVRQTGITGE